MEGELNSALKDLKKKEVARQGDEKASAVTAALAEKAQAQHSKQLAGAEAANAQLKLQVAKLSKLTRAEAAKERANLEKRATVAEAAQRAADAKHAELKRDMKAALKRETAFGAERAKLAEAQRELKGLREVIQHNWASEGEVQGARGCARGSAQAEAELATVAGMQLELEAAQLRLAAAAAQLKE